MDGKECLMTPFCKRGESVKTLDKQQLANMYFHGPIKSLRWGLERRLSGEQHMLLFQKIQVIKRLLTNYNISSKGSLASVGKIHSHARACLPP